MKTRQQRSRLSLVLDSTDPVPLYHQIVQAIRWRIGTGVLRAGDALPPIRSAAKDWGVHLHTVRRAYGILSEAGMLDSRPGAGTTVGGHIPEAPPSEPADELEVWVDGLVADAVRLHGLSPVRLAEKIAERHASTRPHAAVVIECNDHQAHDIAGQIALRWDREITAWSLREPGSPPPGLLIGTRFHETEMRRRWPERSEDMHFVSLQVDPRVVRTLRRRVSERRPARLVLCEVDATTGREMSADLEDLTSLPPVEVTTEQSTRAFARLGADEMLLVAPRRWGSVPEKVRGDPRVVEIRHVIPSDELDAIGGIL